jgi:SAM-dependent methyltransferase
MKLHDLTSDFLKPGPHWEGVTKIPWDDPEFSRRMLKEHLTQDHDLASRRQKTIDHHVAWILNNVLGEQPARVLDLGCGPGFYCERLAAAGHSCLGIDISPASIEYGKQNAKHPERCEYIHGDIRRVDYGDGFDLAMMIFGEFNTFNPADTELLLSKVRDALRPGGTVLVEPNPYETIKGLGIAGPSWYQSDSGLFSNRPHVCFQANHWDEEGHSAQSRFFVIDQATSEVTRYTSTAQAYTDDELVALFEKAGFKRVEILPPFKDERSSEDVSVLVRGEK